jgi:hypothetical protein
MVLRNAGFLRYVAALLIAGSRAAAARLFRNLAGRDFPQSAPSAFGLPDWTIKQTAHELILDAGGQISAFRLDGTEHVYVDESLGDLPNFVRKIRTKAFWDESMLHTERTSCAEATKP